LFEGGEESTFKVSFKLSSALFNEEEFWIDG
jgi:hypothetical protein